MKKFSLRLKIKKINSYYKFVQKKSLYKLGKDIKDVFNFVSHYIKFNSILVF